MDIAMTEGPDKPGAPPRRKRTAQAPSKRAPSKAPGRPERPRGGPARAISDLMPEIGGAAFRKFGFIQSSIVTRWAEIIGKRYAELTNPEAIRFPPGKRAGGTLKLVVAPGHAPMVQHIIPEIIERVNRFFGYGAVSRVTIRTGDVAPREPAGRPPPPMLRPIPAEFGEGLREVSDPELRAVLESMALGLANSAKPPKIS